MIDTRKYGHALCPELGLEPAHRILRPVTALYRYQSVCGHRLRSRQEYHGGQGEDFTPRQKAASGVTTIHLERWWRSGSRGRECVQSPESLPRPAAVTAGAVIRDAGSGRA